MSFERSPTQALTEDVAQKIRMRCNPGYYLQLDSVIEHLDSESERGEARKILTNLYHKMKAEDGIDANI